MPNKKAARLLFQLPRESRIFKVLQPASEWGWLEVFDNRIVHLLETIVWQNATPSKPGEKAKHKLARPEIYRPPFMPKRHTGNDIRKGVASAPVDQIKEMLARPRK